MAMTMQVDIFVVVMLCRFKPMFKSNCDRWPVCALCVYDT